MDTGVKRVGHMSEMLSDDQSVEPTTSHVSTNRDMNIKPTKASRRLLGMSTAVDPPSCLHNPISYNVTLRHGLRSGHFKDQGRVDNFEVCFSQCCHDNDCDLVYLLHNYCYLVSCYDQESCALNPLVATVSRELAVAFVYKERNNELLGWNQAPTNHMSSLPAYFEADKTLENKPSALNQQSVGMSGQIADSSRRYESTYGEARPTYEDKPETFPIERMRYRTDNDNSPATANVSPVTRNTVQYPENSPTCIPGVERYFTTLEGGLSPGYFEEMKFITNMETCKAYCCQKPDCDVALMQQEKCYLVTCPRSELCRDVPAGFETSRRITRISHMKRKGRSSVHGEGINGNLGEVMSGNRDSFRLGVNRKIMDDISNLGVDNNPNFYNFENPVEGTSDTRENQGGHDHINSHSNGDSFDSKVRNVIRDKQNNERNGLGDRRDFHDNEGIREDQDIVKNMERKDIIPTAYQNNLPLDTDDKRHDEEMNLLQDAIGDIEQRKHLHDEQESYGMRISSEIPTPPSQTKTDFEKIFSKERKDPLIFDDLARKRHDNLQEGLGDMASDILSNILKHRATDSIESILSSNKDPLEHEVTKAKETNTPEKIEKELQQPQEHVASTKQHKAMSSDKEQSVLPGSNAKISEKKQGTSVEKNGGLDDQSKLIETLYNLVKESSKTKSEDSMKNKGSYDKQGTHFKEHKTNDENMDLETSKSRASDAEDEFPDYFDSVENSYDSLTPSHLGIHFRHVHESHPRLEVNEEDNANYGGQDYDNLDDEIYDEENTNRNAQQDLDATENGEREQKLHENAYQSLHDRKIKEKHRKTNSILDQDLDFITDKLGEQEIQDRNTYGPNNEINRNEFLDYGDNNFDYSDHSSNMDYYDPIGVKRKLLHVRPAHVLRQNFQLHHKSTNPYWLNSKENAIAAVDRKPLVFIERKQPAGQENDNLVMNELEKIEDELSDIKTRPKLRENSVKHRDTSNLVTEFQPKDDMETKQSIVDILANLKDVSNPELNKNSNAEESNKSNKLIVAKSDDEKLILDELNDIKKAIGNMSKPSGNVGKRKTTPKGDDIGDDISELLDENWDIDKRSRIPKPNTADQLARGRSRAGFRGSLGKDDDTRGKIYFVGMYLVS